jgi:rifampicin phosphotransferase
VAAYRAQQTSHAPEQRRMCVLVQRLISARLAGVAFTADPLIGDKTETIVSAVRGLAERLVSGEAAADEWVVRGGVATCRVAPEGVLDAPAALAIASLARRAEVVLGHPVDVEWAIDDDGQLWLVQARPITRCPT